jgi:hypothetical protein
MKTQDNVLKEWLEVFFQPFFFMLLFDKLLFLRSTLLLTVFLIKPNYMTDALVLAEVPSHSECDRQFPGDPVQSTSSSLRKYLQNVQIGIHTINHTKFTTCTIIISIH